MAVLLANHYVLAVPDRHASARFYVDVLGFEIVNEPEGWVFVRRDNCMIMLGECPDAIPAGQLGDHSYFAYLVVDDADDLFGHCMSRGATLISPIADKPWQMREFGVRTPDGHRIMIGHRLSPPAEADVSD